MNPHYVDINELPDQLRNAVLEWVAANHSDNDLPMTYRKVAEMFGYQYETVKLYASNGSLQVIHTPSGPRVRPSEMARFIASRKRSGRKRKTSTNEQSATT
jgi:hypothetical protein